MSHSEPTSDHAHESTVFDAAKNTATPTIANSLTYDAISGFLVFLIALPLCLAIARASGFPAIAGIFTAVVGGLVTPFITNSQLTIKGPAAGLIMIVLGCVGDMKEHYCPELVAERDSLKQIVATDASAQSKLEEVERKIDRRAYQLALGIGAAAAVLQIGVGLVRGGALGDFFPSTAVHGLLASIGIMIMAKQFHVLLGQVPKQETFENFEQIPHSISHANWEVTTIGLLSLAVLIILPLIRNRYVRKIPGPLVVLLLAIPLGLWFDLEHEHIAHFFGHEEKVGPNFLVNIPNSLLGAVTTPDFAAVTSSIGMKWIVMYLLIGTLESMLSAKAIDLIDPWRRKSNLNRDVLAVGVANLVSSCIGGLPMISEIVRSSANVNNGGRTKFANFFHGLFLFGFVALLPGLIREIPLAGLAAMLCYTGFRLASPREFFNILRVGKEQLAIFVVTIVTALATDLLIGIGAGIAVEWIIHWWNGMSFKDMFLPSIEEGELDDGTTVVRVRNSIVFSNWISFKRMLPKPSHGDVILDVSESRLIDHTVMEKLHELEADFHSAGHRLELVGLDNLRPFSDHPKCARKRSKQDLFAGSGASVS